LVERCDRRWISATRLVDLFLGEFLVRTQIAMGGKLVVEATDHPA